MPTSALDSFQAFSPTREAERMAYRQHFVNKYPSTAFDSIHYAQNALVPKDARMYSGRAMSRPMAAYPTMTFVQAPSSANPQQLYAMAAMGLGQDGNACDICMMESVFFNNYTHGVPPYALNLQ